MSKKHEKAIFAAGCFWGVENAFGKIPGVVETRVGYSGGHTKKPTYEDVLTRTTGHAEAVEVTFDPEKVSFEDLLAAFWDLHDPTTLNRQGPDVGDNYRSAIFYLNEHQKETAVKSKEILGKSGRYKKPIVTEIAKAGAFWPAEEYHQKYFQKNSGAACHV